MSKLKVKKDDIVIVTKGKDVGKEGKIIKVFPKENKALVSGVNLSSRHTKPTKEKEGGIFKKEMPINISNISIKDPETGKPSKVGYKFLENGKKVRFSKISGQVIDKEGK